LYSLTTRTRSAAATVAMATKRKAVNIGTHSGTFHCDEALGCWMLKQTEQFAGDHGYRSAARNSHPLPARHSSQQPHTLWQQSQSTLCVAFNSGWAAGIKSRASLTQLSILVSDVHLCRLQHCAQP
jgi:hypothetical protein